MAALHTAIGAGVRLIHSNPKLFTQWAIRRVLDLVSPAPQVRYLIKAEALLDAAAHVVADKISSAIEASRERLAIDRLHAVVLEIDIKRTSRPELLDDAHAVEAYYQLGADVALGSGDVDHVYAYCQRPGHVAASLVCPDIAGVAAQYHLADPWAAHHFAEITFAGRAFVGMSPLNRGALINWAAGSPRGRLAALQWALADSRVSAVAITISSVAHLEDVIRTFGYSELASHQAQLGSWPVKTQAVGDLK